MSAFHGTVEGAVNYTIGRNIDLKGWFICYHSGGGHAFFCMSPYAVDTWSRIPGWCILGVLRPDGKYKLRRGWKQRVVLARLMA